MVDLKTNLRVYSLGQDLVSVNILTMCKEEIIFHTILKR